MQISKSQELPALILINSILLITGITHLSNAKERQFQRGTHVNIINDWSRKSMIHNRDFQIYTLQ